MNAGTSIATPISALVSAFPQRPKGTASTSENSKAPASPPPATRHPRSLAMHGKLSALLLILGCSPQLAGAASSGDPLWANDVRTANSLSAKCSMRKQDADCAAAVSHYDNAMAAVDATAGVRHEVFKWRMNTVSIRGNNLLEAGDTQRALKVLGDGHTLVMTHYGEGAHRHTIIDNLSLFRAYLAALVASGKVATATDMAVLPRETANDYHAEIDKSRDDKNKTSLILEAMLRSEELETGYGDALMARAHSLSATDSARTELHALAVQAYRIAIVWLRRADEQGYEMPFKNTNPVRFAHLNNSLGKALQATGDRQGAMTAHGLAYAAANCQSLKDNSMDEWDANSAVRPCNDAVSGYMSASGETQKRATEMAEVMYRQQMELYGTDISDLLRSRN